MNNIIAIHSRTIAGTPTKAVSAKKLHEFLQVGRRFASWISGRIDQYGFVEGEDYIIERRKTLSPNGEKANGRPVVNYYLTLDMAKELAMVERNEQGKQARRYFIECEKQLAEQRQLKLEPVTRQRFLQVVENGKVISITEVPPEAGVFTMDQMIEYLDFHGKAVITNKDFRSVKNRFADLGESLDNATPEWQKKMAAAG